MRAGVIEDYDPKWGRFRPETRFNVDQTPLPFVIDHKRTYEVLSENQRYQKVWIHQPGSGLDKRQCTLQVCFRPEGSQPRLAIIFRGTGKRISEYERMSWHPEVDVYFQENAWDDTAVSTAWVEKTLSRAVSDVQRFVLFGDNLSAQQTEPFKEAVSKLSGIVWFGVSNATDLWQPVDAGYGQLLKTLVKKEQSIWLEDDENSDWWYGHTKTASFSAMERRILISNWCGETWKRLSGQEYDSFRLRCSEQTGALITADGSDDSKITPDGLPGYKVPPPVDYLEPSVEEPNSNVPPNEHVEPVDDDEIDRELQPDVENMTII